MKRLSFVVGLVLLSLGCKGEETLDPHLEKLGRATGPVERQSNESLAGKASPVPKMPPHGMMPQPGTAGKVHRGQVLETIDASRYTYVRVQVESGGEIWTAIPQTKLEIGKQVEIIESIVMKDFESKTLKRTFPNIIFGVLKGHENEMPNAI